MRIIITIFLLLISFYIVAQSPENAKFIWENQENNRHEYVYFRYDFELDATAQNAQLNIFADSRYHLHINGTAINFGPSRFYPEAPEYDTYNILPYLKKGNNVIAIKALSHGINTYQLVRNKPGFIAWGKIKTLGKTISIATPKGWICKKSTAYDQTAPKFSFAQGAIDIFDARKAIQNWDQPRIDVNNWKTPVTVKNQDVWGKLNPRTIPFLTQQEIIPKYILGKYALKNEEHIYSFRIKIPDATKEQIRRNPWVFAYTYIYSPKEQVVEAGLWWGEHFLNGQGPLPAKPIKEGRYRRHDRDLMLKKGWNFFFIKYGIVFGHWDFYMALPKGKGLEISPYKKKNDEAVFLTAGPFDEQKDTKIKKGLELPLKPSQLQDLTKKWTVQIRNNSANNPAIETAWAYFDKKIEHEPSKVKDIPVEKQTGTALVYDIGQNSYGRAFVEFTAPEGTIVDLAWAEDKTENNRIFILKRFELFTAARCIAKQGFNRFEVFVPHGMRYLQVTFTNNKEKAVLHKAGIIRQNFPMQDVGKFECSDQMFNSIWQLGKRTIKLCADEVYTDPFRERGIYAGDLLPETVLGYVVSGETKLTRKSMQQIQGLYAEVMKDFYDVKTDRHGIGVLEEYPLITLLNLRWYLSVSRDTNFIQQSYPKYKAMLDSMLERRQPNGLFAPQRAFIEWIQIEKRDVQLAAVHALIARALEDLSALAKITGHNKDAEKYALLAKETKAATRKHFWDNQRKAYFDGFKNNKKINHFFPASSAWPSLYDVSSVEQEKHLRRFFDEELDSIGNVTRQNKTTPYGGFYILGALYKNENADIAEDFMRKYWSRMILGGDDTAWENFGKDGGQGSLSHGWSAAPTYYMSTQILGVQLGFPEPDKLTKVTICPQAESISWAKGVVPHPTGPVAVEWKIKGDNLILDYKVSQGTEVIVKPKGKLSKKQLWVNGKKMNE